MIITKRHLPRRTVLRGLGATMALRLLDGMVPGTDRPRQDGRRPRAASGDLLCAQRDGDVVLDAEDAGDRLRVAAHLEVFGAVSGSASGPQRPRGHERVRH